MINRCTKISFLNATAIEAQSLQETIKGIVSYVRGSVLDVGCGDRPYEEFFEGRYDQYIGIDLETVNSSRADVFGDSLRLPFKANSFDTVLSTQVLEHVRDPFRMFQEAARVLRIGGTLVITAPQSWPLHEKPYDFFRFTRFGLQELSRQATLTVVELRERHGGICTLAELFCVMLYTRHGAQRTRRIVLKPLFWLIQRSALLVDRLFYFPDLTLGYILIARKPP